MRRSLLKGLVLAVCALLMAGCATLPGASALEPQGGSKSDGDPVKVLFGLLRDVVSSAFSSKENELKRLVESGSFQAAADYWAANGDDLSKSSTARALVPAIATGIGQQHAAEATSSQTALNAVQGTAWIAKPGEWADLKARVTTAESLVKRVREHPFFVANPAAVPSSIQGLDEALAAARTNMRNGAVQAFIGYDHRSKMPFFEAFPIVLNARTQSALVVRGSALWLKALLGGTEEQARSVAKAYAGFFKAPEARLMIASAYAGVVARERKWGNQRNLPQVLQLMQVLDAAGLDSSIAARSVKIGILRGLNPQADDFRWATTQPTVSNIEAHDLPISALNDWAREVASVKPSQIYILIDPSRITARWHLTSLTSRSGERQVGQRVSRNPDWDSARQGVEEARREYAEAETANQKIQSQAQQLAAQSAGRSIGILGAMLSSSAGSMSLSSARSRMEAAESKFASTPETVRTPVTRPYQSALASFEGVRKRDTGIYVVNGASGRFYKLDMEETHKVLEQILFGIDPTDPGFAAANTRNRAAQQQFRQFAAGEPYPASDDIWKKLTSSTETSTTPIARLEKTVRDDHTRWSRAAAADLAKAQASTQQLEERVLKIVEASK